MAIVPPMFSKHFGVCNLHKFYVYFLSFMVIGAFVFSAYKVFTLRTYDGDTIHIVIYFFIIFISFIKNIISVLRVPIFKADLYRKFQKRILDMEVACQVKCWNFNTMFIMLNLSQTFCTIVSFVRHNKCKSITPASMFWFEF